MSMLCPIHKTHFGKGFAGRGRRRCYECERSKMDEPFYDSLYLALRDGLPGAEISPMRNDADGNAGVLRVTMGDGRAYSIHFDKA